MRPDVTETSGLFTFLRVSAHNGVVMHPYRTRFKKEIVAEFYPPLTRRRPKQDRVIIFCVGHPAVPGSTVVLEYWAKKGFWIFRFRYRGSWESSGRFLAKSPERDVLDILDELPRGFREASAHQRYRIGSNANYYVFGGSFGGPAAILASRDPRVTKAVCVSPVTDWRARGGERIDRHYRRYTEEAFGEAYRFAKNGVRKLQSGTFYNPMPHAAEIDGKKVLIFHAKDDDVVRYGPVAKFAKKTGATLVAFKRGGHGSSSWFVKPRVYKKIAKFLKEK
jgi:alpha-beta hydrolase superfamily lysophospholipase